jgi:nuclear transport factor 2 (NTF2) superfamily protein
MDVQRAAERWATTWEQAWAACDPAPIAALYAPDALYRSLPFRDPEAGGALVYTTRTFAEESAVECVFGMPVAAGDRAAVEWWASWVEDGRAITLAGSTFLRFDPDGLVVDHVDYWVEADGRVPPFAGWGGRAS